MSRQYLHAVGTLLLVVTIIPFVIFAVPQVTGATHSFVVTSSSMSPAIHAGDVVIVDDVRPAEIEQGDIITFERHGGSDDQQLNTNRVTHRVVEVIERDEGHYFRTKGDANEEPDSKIIPAKNVIGQVIFTIPLIGWVISYAGTDTGIIAFVIVPTIALVASELWNLYQAAQPASENDSEESPPTPDD